MSIYQGYPFLVPAVAASRAGHVLVQDAREEIQPQQAGRKRMGGHLGGRGHAVAGVGLGLLDERGGVLGRLGAAAGRDELVGFIQEGRAEQAMLALNILVFTAAGVIYGLEQAAVALTAVVTDPDTVVAKTAVTLQCSAPDPELLLVDWLNAIVYAMAVQHMLFSRFEVRIDGRQLSGYAWGETIDIARHQPAVEVKGATYTELKVAQDPVGRWIAQCIVDV